MATVTQTSLVDDIDGGQAVETIAFSIRGSSYEIDLNEKNSAALDKALTKYVDHARKAGRATASTRGKSAASSSGKRTDLAEIRAWATDQGYEISSRGRIAAEITEAYDAAH